MTATNALATVRAEAVRADLARRNLVYLQLGYSFEPLRAELLTAIGGKQMEAASFVEKPGKFVRGEVIVLTELERFCKLGSSTLAGSLGVLREAVNRGLDAGTAFCLVSRSPRSAFPAVPGSSVVEEAAPNIVHLISADEIDDDFPKPKFWSIPAVSCGVPGEGLLQITAKVLGELGPGVLSDLAEAFFDIDPVGANGLDHVNARTLEAMRGAGLLTVDADHANHLVLHELKTFRDALSTAVSSIDLPQAEFAEVVARLWTIERKLRRQLRLKLEADHGARWRRSAASGGLTTDIVDRAQKAGILGATTISELADPTEWLMLNELLDLITSKRHKGLGVEALVWDQFREQVIPVRNRVSHMRLLKADDAATVTKWSRIIDIRMPDTETWSAKLGT